MSTIKVNTITDASGGSNVVLQGVASPPNSMGFRNRIINGDCRVAQRGALSITGNSLPSIYGGCDRVTGLTFGFTTATGTLQQSGSGFGVFGLSQAIVNLTTTGSGGITFGQRIESLNIKDCNSNTVTVQAQVFQNTGSSQSLNLRLNKANAVDNFSAVTILSTSSTFTIPTGALTTVIATFTLGATDASNGILVEAFFSGLGAITLKDFHITDFQLEAGSVASPFERRDIGRELIMCQRYFESTDTTARDLYGSGFFNTTTSVLTFWRWSVKKRAIPSLTASSTAAGVVTVNYASAGAQNSAVSSITFSLISLKSSRVDFTVALTVTAGTSVLVSARGENGFFLSASAEL